MSDGSLPWTEDGRETYPPRYHGRWWTVGALVGLLAGWLVGLAIKPGPDELLAAARALAPPGPQITEAVVTGEEFELIDFNSAPHADVHLVSDLPPGEWVRAMEENAVGEGWTILRRYQLPNAIEVELRTTEIGLQTTLLEGEMSVRPGAVEFDGSIWVRRHDWTGPVLVASASILGGLVFALVLAGAQRRFMSAPGRLYRPWRWWHTTGVLMTAALFWFCLTFVR